MKTLFAVMLGVAALALGQAKTPVPTLAPKVSAARPGDVVRVLPIKGEINNFGSNSTFSTLRTMYPSGSGVEMALDAASRTLIVRGPASAVKLIEETFQKLDVAMADVPLAANVEVTVHVLYASSKDEAKGSVPADLQPTVQQLRGIFPYASYRVMDVMLSRSRDNQAMEDSGTLAGTTTIYQIRYTPIVAPGTAPRMVRLKGLQFSLRTPNGSVGLNTDIDVREGQKTVVGKSNVSGTDDAIILVVSPKVIQ